MNNSNKNSPAKLDRIGEFLLKKRIAAVLPHISGRLLDIGCGTNRLVREYGNGIGVDVFRFGDADLIVKDSSDLPFPDESFDTVTIIAALNHIPNRREVLQTAHRLLRPGGRLLVTMLSPGISAIWHRIRAPWDRDQHERGMKSGEVYGISPGEMAEILHSGGFRIMEVKRFLWFLNRLYIVTKN